MRFAKLQGWWLGVGLGLFLISGVTAMADWEWILPSGFPEPNVPADNPMTAEKVELGRYLFYDRRLSVNGKQSCADCHKQSLAFTDGRSRAEGSMGDAHPRSSMSLVNVAFEPRLNWANPNPVSLEDQALISIIGDDPPGLGLTDHEQDFLDEMRKDATYRRLFPAAFPQSRDVNLQDVAKALAAFERSIVSARSGYDKYKAGDANAISAAAKRGEAMFFSEERAACSQCHGGPNFNTVEGSKERPVFFNTGVEKYEAPNRGLYEFTGRSDQFGQFRVPSLRNVELTDPYMHDGNLATLEEVIDHYAAGGKFDHMNKTEKIRPFPMTEEEKDDLIEFLKSLTDRELLRDLRWSNPWPTTPGQ